MHIDTLDRWGEERVGGYIVDAGDVNDLDGYRCRRWWNFEVNSCAGAVVGSAINLVLRHYLAVLSTSRVECSLDSV